MKRWLALSGVLMAAAAQAAPSPEAQIVVAASSRLEACRNAGATTIALEQCYAAETARWDARLNAAFKRAMASGLTKATKDELHAAQRAWIAYVPLKCGAAGDMEYEGGTMARIAFADCKLKEVALRAVELEMALGPQG